MWIQIDNDTTRVLASDGHRVEFTSNGTAQVEREVGEYFTTNYDAITEYNDV